MFQTEQSITGLKEDLIIAKCCLGLLGVSSNHTGVQSCDFILIFKKPVVYQLKPKKYLIR